jgi:hypothetical protein
VFLGGVALYFRAPSRFSLQGEEVIIEAFHPRVVLAYILMTASLPTIAASIYVYEYTTYPYIFVFIPLLLGLYLLISGFLRYWRNTLTTYYLTSERIVRASRFLSMNNNHLEIENISAYNAGRKWYTGILGIQQATFKSHSGSLRLRDSPTAMDIVGTYRRAKKELMNQRMQEAARMNVEATRTASDDSVAASSDQRQDDEHSESQSQAHTRQLDDSNSNDPDSTQSTDGTGDEQSSQSGPTRYDREHNDGESESAVDDVANSANNSSAADMLDVDKAKQLLDGYVAEWCRGRCQSEHHRELIAHQAAQLEKAGIEVIVPEIGGEFNPRVHECTAHVSSPEPENTIILVEQVGLRGQGVSKRDARVVTSSGPE